MPVPERSSVDEHVAYECPYCGALHRERYGQGRNPACPHRGDAFKAATVRGMVRWEAVINTVGGRKIRLIGAADGTALDLMRLVASEFEQIDEPAQVSIATVVLSNAS